MIAFPLITLIMVLAAVQVLVLGMLVGRARLTYKVEAPATTGPPEWERLNRAHLNSLEQLVVFTPLFLAYCVNTHLTSGIVLGIVYLVARTLYAIGYVRDPARRAPGAFLTLVVQVWLAAGAVIGLVVKMVRA